jgi:hypothetical protein
VDSATITAGAASPYTYQIGVTPVRNFTYVNIGPSFDFGPSLDLTTPIEIGANARYEQTSSAVGTLTSTWLLGGLRVGFFPGVEATVAYSERDFNGAEEGYFPFTGNAVKPQPFTTPLARYSYLNDPSDLGFYRIFQMNGNNQSLLYSLAIEVNRNSKLYFDYSLTQGTEIVNVGPVLSGAVPGTLYNQYMGGTYDIKF